VLHENGRAGPTVQVTLLGPFSVTAAGRVAGPWPRPAARRLCQLVLVSPGRRVSRDVVGEELFPDLEPRAAARSVSKALSMARAALGSLGAAAGSLLAADLTHIWAAEAAQVDAEAHEAALRAALSIAPGPERDDRFVAALAEARELLAEEPYVSWATRPRERLEALRQLARLTLARDRAKGAGRSRPEAVTQAWESCFEHDPADEEAAAALISGYVAQGRREHAVRVYERCTTALGELGLRASSALEEVYATAAFEAAADQVAPGTPTARPAALREELRTVSVLSAQVATVAGLARKLDLETLRDVVRASLAAVISEVEALGGTVTSVSGGEVQAVFGSPEAHEDDPERAVRAAFRALAAAEAVDHRQAVRIGVETGQALLGPIGAGPRVEYGAVGEVVGTAIALRSSARPGSALVGPVTRAATSHLFTWEASETVTLDGVVPLTASYLGRPRAAATGRRLRLDGRVPLAGRQPELAALDAAVREAIRGRGSVVLLTGEPGFGKTRLVQECRRRLAAWTAGRSGNRRPLWLEGRCASYASATPYGLYQQVLASWAGVAADQPATTVRPALEQAVSAAMGRADLVPLLARMMGSPADARLGRMSPEELHGATFAALTSLISRLMAGGPVILVLEDLHWADPTSLHFTEHLARLTRGRPLLLLATSRPEAAMALDQSRQITLRPLSGTAERGLARSLLGEAASEEVLETVLTNTEGNPLFLEERLSALLETGALVHGDAGWRIGEAAGPETPRVLERLVRSRVDRLTPMARDVVRTASVLGAEFPLSLLTAVMATDGPLGPAVAELCDKDLVREVASGADPVLRFRHAVIQEATYDGLLRTERRLLHGRAAWALEAASADRTEEVAAVLGRHFAAAGEAERALEYLELSGDHATGAFANNEAIASFRAALAEAGDLREAGELPAAAATRIQAKLANVLWRTARRGEARQAFTEGLRLADAAADADAANADAVLLRAHLLTRLGRLEMAERRYDAAATAFDAAEALLGTDPMTEDDAVVDQWLEMMLDGRADLYALRNEHDLALATLEVARPVLEARGTPPRKYSFYHVLAIGRVIGNRHRVDDTDIANVRISASAAAQCDDEKDTGYGEFFVGWMLWLHGDLAAAQEHLEKSLALAERIGEAVLLGESLVKLALTALRRHDTEAVRPLAQRAIAAADAMDSSDSGADAKACQVWLAWQDGRPHDVIRLSEELAELGTANTYHVAAGITPHKWIYLWPLIAARLDAGDVAAAVAAGRQLLDPAQLWLPDELDSAVGAACRAWDEGEPETSRARLTAALTLAYELRYF
jgi:adenylate cyclase